MLQSSAQSFADPSEQEIAWLQNLIFQYSGFLVQERNVPALRWAIRKICEQHACDMAELFARLRHEERGDALHALISHVTIGESYFFRDQAQMNLLRTQLLPALIARKRHGDRRLRIWSAGCARGQELYTLYLLLAEALPDIAQWRLELLGTDINQAFVAEARAGSYSAWSLRNTSEQVRTRYFRKHAGEFEIVPLVRQACHFSMLNLVSEPYAGEDWPTGQFDLILCRNVFIYFDQSTVERVGEKLAASLSPDGYLLLGGADRWPDGCGGLYPHFEEGAQYYTSLGNRCEELGAPAVSMAAPPMTSSEPRSVDDGARCHALMSDAIPALKAMANQGDPDHALALAQSLVQLHPTEKEAHFLLGFLHAERGDWNQAKASWQRALFLDLDYFEAQCQLGMCALREGNHLHAKRYLKNALQIASKKPVEAVSIFDANRTYGQLVEVLTTEMSGLGLS